MYTIQDSESTNVNDIYLPLKKVWSDTLSFSLTYPIIVRAKRRDLVSLCFSIMWLKTTYEMLVNSCDIRHVKKVEMTMVNGPNGQLMKWWPKIKSHSGRPWHMTHKDLKTTCTNEQIKIIPQNSLRPSYLFFIFKNIIIFFIF